MARRQNIGDTEDWFIGEDKTIPFELYDSTEAAIVNAAAYTTRFILRKSYGGDAVIFTKTSGGGTITVTGSYNADPDVNTQRTNVLVEDTDTDNLQPGLYWYSLWRTDAGNEAVLAYGDVHLKAAP